MGYWRWGGEGEGSTDPSQGNPVLSVHDRDCVSPFMLLPHLVLKQIHAPSFGFPNDPCLGQSVLSLWLSVALCVSEWPGTAGTQGNSLRRDPSATQVQQLCAPLENNVLTKARSKEQECCLGRTIKVKGQLQN